MRLFRTVELAIGRASIRYCVSDLPVDEIDYSWNGVYVCVHSD